MKLEQRYLVFKIKDIVQYLSSAETDILCVIADRIDFCRRSDDKTVIEGIFIEKDWPEYEPTLKLLSERVNNE